MFVKTETDLLEKDESGLSTCMVDMIGPDLARQFQKDMFNDQAVRVFLARKRQLQIAKAHSAPRHALANGARHILEVDEEAFLDWHDRERGCWSDRGFLREFIRDNDSCAIKQAGVGAGNRVAWTPEVDHRPQGIPHILVTDKRGNVQDVYVSAETIAQHVKAQAEEAPTLLESLAMEGGGE